MILRSIIPMSIMRRITMLITANLAENFIQL
jgi:hypothetical protein